MALGAAEVNEISLLSRWQKVDPTGIRSEISLKQQNENTTGMAAANFGIDLSLKRTLK